MNNNESNLQDAAFPITTYKTTPKQKLFSNVTALKDFYALC